MRIFSEWTFQWKLICNPDPTKHAQEVICHNTEILKLSRLCLGLSQFFEHKCNYSLTQLLVHLLKLCHFLLHCSNFSDERLVLLSLLLRNIDTTYLQQNNAILTHIVLVGNASFDKNPNTLILEAIMDYLVITGRSGSYSIIIKQSE